LPIFAFANFTTFMMSQGSVSFYWLVVDMTYSKISRLWVYHTPIKHTRLFRVRHWARQCRLFRRPIVWILWWMVINQLPVSMNKS
jgi:hypothetical protein